MASANTAVSKYKILLQSVGFEQLRRVTSKANIIR